MGLDLEKASRRLSELDLKITVDNLLVDILWFRAMTARGEWNISRHMHSTFEFHFIYSGCCKVLHDGGEFEVKAGEFYLTSPSVYHEQRSSGHGDMIEFSINCDIKQTDEAPSEFGHILSILSAVPCAPFKDTHGSIKLFHKALFEAYHQNLGFYNNIKSLAEMILVSAARTLNKNAPVKYDIPVKLRKGDYRLAQIERFIGDNIINPISTKDIAAFMHLSDKQVCRIILEKKGLSTKELITRLKLQKAKELLKETDLSVKQISYNLGFSSEYYFNQFFKREEGYAPGVFRHNIQNVQKSKSSVP